MKSVCSSALNVVDEPESADTQIPTSSKTGGRWPSPPPRRAPRCSSPKSFALQREAATVRFYSEPQATLPRPRSFAPLLQAAVGRVFLFHCFWVLQKARTLERQITFRIFCPIRRLCRDSEISWDELHPKRIRDQVIWRRHGIVATVSAFFYVVDTPALKTTHGFAKNERLQ